MTTIYNDRYNVNADVATTIEACFTNGSSQNCVGTFEPCAGTMKYGWAQDIGNSNIQYTLSYKKTSSKKYINIISNFTFAENGKYYGEYYICNVNGKNNYNFKITKDNYRSTKSKVVVDIMVI